MHSAITIRQSDRAFFCGRTGSGKTTLAKLMLMRYPRFVALDPKHTLSLPGVRITPAYDKHVARQIVRAPRGNRKALYEAAIDEAYRAGNIIIYIDELTMIVRSTFISEVLGDAVRTGRERRIGVWGVTQRPKDVPNAFMTETDHFVIFQLINQLDKRKLVGFIGDRFGNALDRISGHDFVYYNVARDAGYYVEAADLSASGLQQRGTG